MTDTISCPCGQIQWLTPGAREVVCPRCGNRQAVAGRGRRRSVWRHPVTLVLGGGFLLVAGAVAIGLWLFLRQPYDPTPRPTLSEKYAAIAAGFDPAERVPVARRTGAEGEVARALEDWVEADRTGDAARAVALYHAERTWTEVAAFAGLNRLESAIGRSFYVATADQVLGEQLQRTDRRPFEIWKRVDVYAVRPVAGRDDEMVAYGRVEDGDGVLVRWRFWWIDDGGTWKIFDWENVEQGWRSSRIEALIMADGADAIDRTGAVLDQTQRAFDHQAAGRIDDARAVLDRALSIGPPGWIRANVLFARGRIEVESGEAEVGLDWLERCLDAWSDFPLAVFFQGVGLEMVGRLDEAAAAFERYHAMLGPDGDVAYRLAGCLAGAGRVDEALAAYGRAVALDPDDTAARTDLGLLAIEEGRSVEGLEALRGAHERFSDETVDDEFESIAVVLHDRGRIDALAGWIDVHRRRRPGDPDIDYYGGLVALDRRDGARAVECFERGLAAAGEEAIYHRWRLVAALVLVGRFDDARTEADRVLAEAPEWVEVLRARAMARLGAGDAEGALADLEAYLDDFPEEADSVEAAPEFEALRQEKAFRVLIDRARAGGR